MNGRKRTLLIFIYLWEYVLWPMSFTRVGGPTIKKISTLSFSKFSLLTSQPRPFSRFMFPYGWAHFQLHRLGLLVVTALLVLLWRFAVSWWSALTRAYSRWRAGWSDHKAAEQNEDYHHKLLFKMWSTSLSTGREAKWREAITRSFIVRVYILWFINVFKRGCTSFHAHTHALPAQASCFIDDYSGGLVFLLGELNNHILGPCA